MNKKIIFKDISSRTWEHPADRAALASLKQIPVLDQLIKKFVGVTTEKFFRLLYLSTTVRISKNQFPKIYSITEEACQILDIAAVPEVYVTENPVMNAGVLGVEKPFLILNSSLVESFTREETAAVIGHELGHYLSGHALYKTLLYILLNTALPMLGSFVPAIALQAIMLAFLEWNRKSELSADRAGVLVCQNPEASYTVLMKLAGGKQISEMNINDFFLQAADYDRGGDLLDSVYKLFHLLSVSHPLPVLRLKELKTWIDAGYYQKILAGEYMTRQQSEQEKVEQEMNKAYQQYRADTATSEDPLSKIVTSFNENMESFTKQAGDFFQLIIQ